MEELEDLSNILTHLCFLLPRESTESQLFVKRTWCVHLSDLSFVLSVSLIVKEKKMWQCEIREGEITSVTIFPPHTQRQNDYEAIPCIVFIPLWRLNTVGF